MMSSLHFVVHVCAAELWPADACSTILKHVARQSISFLTVSEALQAGIASAYVTDRDSYVMAFAVSPVSHHFDSLA